MIIIGSSETRSKNLHLISMETQKVWYVIAGFNRKPTESHVSLGERIRIPVSLADALQVVE